MGFLRLRWGSPKVKYYQAGFNWEGPVPVGLSWETASRLPVVPMALPEVLKICPECRASVIERRYDYDSQLKQHMVIAYECPAGHGAFLDWA